MAVRLNKRALLSSPTMHGDEQRFVQEAFDTNWVSTIGENINRIEAEIAEYVGCEYAVALGTGTSSIHLATRMAGVKPDEKVFCTDVTFSATVNPVVYEKGYPVFIDSEYDTWNMDPAALERAFAEFPEVKTVVVANLYGTPARLDEIRAICDNHGAVLIEDAAESLGATYKGRQTGTFGKYNCISFNGNKIITGSSGGMFLTDDADAAAKVRKWSTQSREPAPWYQHIDLGFNYRMSNIIAGVVRGQLIHLEEHIGQKKALYERYRDGLKDLPVKMNPFIADIMEPNYWLSCMIIDRDAMCEQKREDLEAVFTKTAGKSCPTHILEKLNEYNAEGRPIWKPMHMQPIFAGHPVVTTNGVFRSTDEEPFTTVGRDIFERGLCLPSDNKITPEDQDVIIEVIHKCFE